MFTIDGLTWTMPCDITRKAIVTPSDISGMLMDKTWFNDVLATYMQYEVSIVPNPRDMATYYALFDILSEPVSGHDFALPYDDGEIQFNGRVDEISDIYVRMPGGAVYWKGAKFTVTSNEPNREPED